ncbi:MAG: hypothetical protein HYX50_01350 [Chloroflexi bacterium]|nr:hypothetical protein [Chloroflexota bacterium]
MPYVALDLETTGLDLETDEIIEVAAIRFDTNGVLETFHTLVNPHRSLEYRIALLTAIDAAELEAAPPFATIAADLERFIGLDPIVGQNPTFDTAFLARNGVQVFAPTYDTFELASLLLPGLQQHSLGAIAEHLDIEFPTRHRAMADAEATRAVFVALRERLAASPPDVLAEAERISAASDWTLRHLFREVAAEHPRAPGESEREGVVHGFVRAPAVIVEAEPPSIRPVVVAPEESVALIASAAARERIEHFEERPEQAAMARAVAETIAEGDRLIVEAGTGVGKSLAYLVPSALHAARNNARTVISTNTINLQEQLTGQDIPIARRLLEEAGIEHEGLRVTPLKGRRNYLCLLRWSASGHGTSLSGDDARVLVRLLFWLGWTETGDRAEINLRRDEDVAWSRVSAQDGGCMTMQCAYVRDGSCFLYRARKRAEAAHVIVVNHALLLSDVRTGGNVLPDYQHLVVDEAHHLEDEATDQFGFVAQQGDMEAWADRLYARAGREREGGLAGSVMTATRVALQAIGPAPQLQAMASALIAATMRVRDRVPRFFGLLQEFGRAQGTGMGDYDERITLTRGLRNQPEWADIEVAWDAVDAAMLEACDIVDELHGALAQADPGAVMDRDALVAEAGELADAGAALRDGIGQIVLRDDRDRISWLTMLRRDGAVGIASAPLSVSETLRTALFGPKESVVLTSATLTTDGNFDYIKGRLGFEDSRELLLGSPFDYQRSTLIIAPTDMPEPNNHGYLSSLQTAIIDLVRASEGRALVLFTSHAALRAAYQGIKRPLEEDGILVLGQGLDGSPRQLLSTLRGNHRTVLLGAASFWEGVDVTGEALSLLIIARIPFSVPTDPIFQARSELFDAPFEQYALPQAILRFKQGFGRLIRRKSDRGVLVVLDRRLRSRRYGEAFLRSMPPCDVRDMPLREMAAEAAAWLGRAGTPA